MQRTNPGCNRPRRWVIDCAVTYHIGFSIEFWEFDFPWCCHGSVKVRAIITSNLAFAILQVLKKCCISLNLRNEHWMNLERNKFISTFYLFHSKWLEVGKVTKQAKGCCVLFCHLVMSATNSHYHSCSLSVSTPMC